MKYLMIALIAALPLTSIAKKGPLPPMVTKVSKLKFEVSKSRLEKDLRNPESQLATFTVAPSIGMGYMAGLSVSGFKKNCLLPSFGIQEGDVIETVNGQELGGLNDIMEVGKKLSKADVGHKVRLNIKRGDEDVVQTYLIVD